MTSRRVLVYFVHNPWPPRSGAHERCLTMVRGLVELGCEVTFAGSSACSETEWTDASQLALQQLGVRSVFVHVPGRWARLRNQAERVARMVADRLTKPWNTLHVPTSLRRWFTQLVDRVQPDVLLMSYSWTDELVRQAVWPGMLRIMDMLDLLSVNRQLWSRVTHLLQKFTRTGAWDKLFDEDLMLRDELRLDPAEAAIFERYNTTIAISRLEEHVLRSHTRQTQVVWIPVTITPGARGNEYTGNALLTVGRNPFNLQGLLYFVHRVLPLVRREVPDFELEVTGAFQEEMVGVPGVRHLGFVPDLGPVYRRAAMLVCPVFTGTGQQIKIVQAMANGLPVVALQAAARSSPLASGENGLVVQRAPEFAEQVVRLWKDRALCRKLGAAAWETARDESRRYAPASMLGPLLEWPHK